MAPEEIKSLIMTYISWSIAAITIITPFLIWLSKNWILTWIKNSIAHEYNKDLESWKNKLDQETAIKIESLRQRNEESEVIKKNSFSSMAHIHQLTSVKKIEAIEMAWCALVKSRTITPYAVGLLGTFGTEFINIWIKEDVNIKSKMEDSLRKGVITDLMSALNGVNEIRPFLGEYLYSLVTAFAGVIIAAQADAQKWLNDGLPDNFSPEIKHTINLLQPFLSVDEIGKIPKVLLGRLEYQRSILERKFLIYTDETLSGQAAAKFSLEQTIAISQEVSTLTTSLPNFKS